MSSILNQISKKLDFLRSDLKKDLSTNLFIGNLEELFSEELIF